MQRDMDAGRKADMPGAAPRRSRLAVILIGALGLALIAGFVRLGNWQVERRAWKLALIERVEARVRAAPVPAPGQAAWPEITAANAEYLRVRVTGRFRHDRETRVQAATRLGPGTWSVTPLRTDHGFTLLVNRGFVAAGRQAARPDGSVTVTGLLRLSEPGGGFPRRNDPGANRWYSRDVAAIARARGLGPVAPYFIDADAAPGSGGYPRGGLTQVRFRNHHLTYALTWYTLAALVAGALVMVARYELGRAR